MRQGSKVFLVHLGAYIWTAHSFNVNSMNETLTHLLTGGQVHIELFLLTSLVQDCTPKFVGDNAEPRRLVSRTYDLVPAILGFRFCCAGLPILPACRNLAYVHPLTIEESTL